MVVFSIEDEDFLKKYNTIWDKVNPVYNKKFLKTKVKSYGDEATNFYDKKIPKVGSDYTCLAVVNIDSAL